MAIDYRTLLGRMTEAKYPTRATGDIQLQRSIAQAPASSASLNLAQDLGASLAKLQQTKDLKIRESKAKILESQGQNVLTQTGENARTKIIGLEAGNQETNIDNVRKLAQIDAQAKSQLYDMRRKFTQDEMGRKFTNDRQLSDYMKLTAQSDEQFKNYSQNLAVAYDRKRQVMETALSKISNQMLSDSAEAQQLQDQLLSKSLKTKEMEQARVLLDQKLAQINRLKKLEVDMTRQVREAQIEAENKQRRNQAIGSIAGAVVGGVAGGVAGGGPTGAAVGASAGSSIGGGLASILGS